MFTYKTKTFSYSFDQAGKVISFIDLKTNINHAKKDCFAFFLKIDSFNNACNDIVGGGDSSSNVNTCETVNGKFYPSEVCENNGIVKVSFSKPNVSFYLEIIEREFDLKFTIVKEENNGNYYGQFYFAAVETDDVDGKSEFSASARSLSLKCNMLEIPGRCEKVASIAYHRLGATGVSSCLVGAPSELLKTALTKAIEGITIDDIPLNLYGGQFSEDVKAAHEDYLIVGVLDDVDQNLISRLNQLNITQLDFLQGGCYRQADYKFLPDKFPNGVSDFKENVSDKLGENGIICGLHTYSCMVDLKSKYVTPVPSDDLASLNEYVLDKDINLDDNVLYIEGDALKVPLIQIPQAFTNATCLLIDKEIIFFTDKAENGALTGLKRGYLGTTPSCHKKGATVKHLKNMYGFFQAVPGSKLFYELAENMANTYNDGGFSMMYFDGLECIGNTVKCDDIEVRWYYEALFVREVLKRCKKTPIVEYSIIHPLLWGARSRMGAFDIFISNRKMATDLHCEYNNDTCFRRLMPATLGWQLLYPRVEQGPEPYTNWMDKIYFSDEADYLGCKVIGFDSGLSYVVDTTVFDAKREPTEIAKKLGIYSKIKSAGKVSEQVKNKLKEYGKDYRLIENNEEYSFIHTENSLIYPYSFKDGENSGRVINNFEKQSPTIRIEVCCAGKQDAKAEEIIYFDKELPANKQHLLTEYSHEKPLDLTGKETLCVWIYGNGSNEYMCIRLEGAKPAMAHGDHYVKLDFTGWKYFEFNENENGDIGYVQFENDIYKTNSRELVYRRYGEFFFYKAIANVRVLFSNGGNGVKISPICVKPFSPSPVNNLSITCGENKLEILGEVKAGECVEFNPKTNKAKVYNVNGFVRDIHSKGNIILEKGENVIKVNGVGEGIRRAKIQIITEGEII